MPIDLSKVNLDAPLFPSNEGGEVTTTADSAPESGNTDGQKEEVSPTDSGNESVSEQQIPYSRLREAVEARREAERRAEEAEAREYAARESAQRYASENRPSVDFADSGYRAWAQIYGDNENTRKAYAIELERQESLREEYRREAREAVRAEREYEKHQFSSNMNIINQRLDDLSLSLGRPITSKEEQNLLAIVDEYTPMDDSGEKYDGDPISFEKAWEIMELRQATTNQRSSTIRRAPTALTSSRSEGETVAVGKAEADKNWNPRDWNAWRKRVPGL